MIPIRETPLRDTGGLLMNRLLLDSFKYPLLFKLP